MTDILASIPQPVPAGLLALAVLGAGFPKLVLRLLILLYPRDGDRRAELLAELHVIPPWVRPFWVFEQIPLAFREGLADRRSSKVSEVAEPGLPTLDDTANAARLLDERQRLLRLLRGRPMWSEMEGAGSDPSRCSDVQIGPIRYQLKGVTVDLRWPSTTEPSLDVRYSQLSRKFHGGPA